MLAAVPASAGPGNEAERPIPWGHIDDSGQVQLELYFFWSRHCPHCQDARPFVQKLAERHPWLRLHSLELTGHPEHARLYAGMARALGREAASVPAFLFCGTMVTGYDDAEHMGAYLARSLQDCHRQVAEAGGQAIMAEPDEEAVALQVPGLGRLDARQLSLPVLTLVLAAMDSFNPCAFFVLLFLLSLLVHARSRARMLLVGGTFVVVSGLLYFVFMAAWLNLFQLIGHMAWVTRGAGVVAIALAALNVKDFLWLRRGPSLSMSAGARQRLYQRTRGLLGAERLPALVLGSVALALAANTYELFCTAGLPMVFTRILTLRELAPVDYYLYLGLYNLVYILPLLAIVLAFVATLGSRKLAEREGRLLKLLSGVMMLELGLVLVFAPGAMDNLLTALALLLGAVAVTALAAQLQRPAP